MKLIAQFCYFQDHVQLATVLKAFLFQTEERRTVLPIFLLVVFYLTRPDYHIVK